MTTTTLTIKDGNSTAQQLAAEATVAGVLSPHSVPEIAGLPVSGTNPMPVALPSGETLPVSLAAAVEISGTVPISAASALPVSGSLEISNLPATQPVSGTVGISGTVEAAFSGALPAGANAIGSVGQGAAGEAAWLVSDAANAAFQGVVPLTPGISAAAARSIGYVITAAGNVTLTLANGSKITLNLPVAGFTTLPFAVTEIALGSGTVGTFWNLI